MTKASYEGTTVLRAFWKEIARAMAILLDKKTEAGMRDAIRYRAGCIDSKHAMSLLNDQLWEGLGVQQSVKVSKE